MAATRREFLKTGLLAGVAAAVPAAAYAHDPGTAIDGAMAEGLAAAPAGEAPAVTGSTRGIGMYPGAPEEFFGPVVTADPAAPYGNLALRRPAYASSAYDYNLTAQLVTDGLTETTLPTWIAVLMNGEAVPKPQREVFLNHFQSSITALAGSDPSVEVHFLGGNAPPAVDRVNLFVAVPESVQPSSLLFTVSTSEDGHLWKKGGSANGGTPLPKENYPPGLGEGSHLLSPTIVLDTPSTGRYYRVDFSTTAAAAAEEAGEASEATISWRLGEVGFYQGQQRVEAGGSYNFTSAWKSAGLGEEWVYVDLGASFTFDRVTLHWIAPAAEGKLQVSDDAQNWRDLQPLAGASGPVEDVHLSGAAQGRYVRALLTRAATAHGYVLSEMEVWGHGGFTARPAPAQVVKDGRLNLAGGAWKLMRAGEGQALTGEALSGAGFEDKEWLIATVPGTVLTSYHNLGILPDPNYGQNQLQISDSYFYSDFWYRTEFTAPAAGREQVTLLNFEGINWKADVYLNGAKLGHIDGAFTRGRFDVGGKLKAGQPNALAVRIYKNDTPGSAKEKTLEVATKNGGALGADNPTFHASIGWDWIPTIRGRNTGIWNDVSLTMTGAVTLEDPLVTSILPLPAVDHADVTIEVIAVNHTDKPVSGTLRGRFGEHTFEQKVSLGAGEKQPVKLKALHIEKPQLWWPVGYGDPYLHDVEMRFEARGGVTHRTAFKAGIRQMTANENGGRLHMFINGRRFIARGGNWGFGESMLRFRAREYDAAVRYHRDMNFTMVRNWVGQIGEDAFYEACDRHGVVVWQDFWLANPWDGPVPNDNAMFLANAQDYIQRIRRHACVGLYCGRNEWYPPAALQAGIQKLLAELHPDIHYIGSSADGPVSGHGPYRALTTPEYFRRADRKLHSEIGAPAIPPLESVRAMMPERALWPQSLDWGLHDFTMDGAQGGLAFNTLVDEGYGGADNAKDWIALGEMVSYEAYRAMFEAQSKYRMGVLLWMSHPCWPSFVWQTYDWYLQPTAAYFGCKLGSEPLHIQWNSHEETIEVVNYSAGSVDGLTAEVEILNLDGSSVGKKSAPLNSAEDSTESPIHMEYPANLTAVHFLRLTLMQNGQVRSKNFYMRAVEQGDLSAMRTLGQAKVQAQTTMQQHGDRWVLTTLLQNTSAVPALFTQLKTVRATTGDRILPALYSENYITLMPNESRTVTVEVQARDARGEQPKVVVEGFNTVQA